MSDSRWRAWVAAAAIFFLGTTVGGGAVAWFGVRTLRQSLQTPAPNRSIAERAPARIGADLTKTLELTPEESKQVQAILDQTAEELKSMRVQAARDVGTKLRSTIRKISLELPPEKRPAFRRLIIKRYERLGLPAPKTEEEP